MNTPAAAVTLPPQQPAPAVLAWQPDWDRIQQRMLAFWEGQIIDRVMIYVDPPYPQTSCSPMAEAQFWNPDYHIQQQHAWVRQRSAGDVLPLYGCTAAAFAFSSILGGSVRVMDGMAWPEPIAAFWDSPAAQLRVQWDGPMWRLTEAMLTRCLDEAQGKCGVRLLSMNQGIDALAALVSPEQLCLDLIDRPDDVAAALDRIRWAWCLVYETLWRAGTARGAVLSDTLPLWYPGRYGTLQCDFMVMINQDVFRHLVVPDLRACSAYLDKTIFHLDGQEATHHLEALLEIDTIHAIQFQQGNHVGVLRDPVLPFLPMFRRIQQAGKRLYVSCQLPELEPLLRGLSSRGLMVHLQGATEEEGRAAVKLATRLTHD